jgi:hypothetical protein
MLLAWSETHDGVTWTTGGALQKGETRLMGERWSQRIMRVDDAEKIQIGKF